MRFYYFPRPYPDELIGSVILRACRHRATSSKRITAQLSGRSKTYIPLAMSACLKRIASAAGMDAEQLLWEHSLFPYVTSFMSREETDRLAANLLDEQTGGNAALTQSALVGSSGHRFCSKCLREDEAQYGEVYWHREHNLPLVEVCRRHQVPLLVAAPQARQTPIQSAVSTLPAEGAAQPLEPDLAPAIAAAVGDISNECLTRRARQGPVTWAGFYRRSVAAAGLERNGGGLASRRLVAEFGATFGEAYLQRVRLKVEINRSPWPALMLRERQSIPFSTPQHVLMQVFLAHTETLATPAGAKSLYRSPGPAARDYQALDTDFAAKVAQAIQRAQNDRRRVEVTEMLTQLGIWGTYRHCRDKLPLTTAAIADFRQTDCAARQVGRRPRQRPPKS